MVTLMENGSTRQRLVAAMSDALQRRGLHGVGLSELLTQAQAPKGVLYHHFPGGKTELAIAAIDAAVAQLLSALDHLATLKSDPQDMLRAWMKAAQKQLERSGFDRGCPLATVALESGPTDEGLRLALARGFAALRERLSSVLVTSGVAPKRAQQLATLIVAAYEGALMQARVAGHGRALADTTDALVDLIGFELQRGMA